MEPSTGDTNKELSTKGDVVDRKTESADETPRSSSEMKETLREAADTIDMCEKEVEGLHDQGDGTGDLVEIVPENQKHPTTEEKSQKKSEKSGDALVMPSPSTEYSAKEVEKNHNDTDRINSGSPTVISSSETPQNGNVKEGDKISSVQDPPTSDIDKEAHKAVSGAVDPEIFKATNDGRCVASDVPSSTDFSEVDASKKSLPVPMKDGLASTVEGSPTSPHVVPLQSQVPVSGNTGSALKSGRQSARGRPRGSSESKPRRASGKGRGKGSSEKGNILKEPTLLGQPESRGESGVLLNTSGMYQNLESNKKQRQRQAARGTSKSFGLHTDPVPSIPELKASGLPNPLQQPFTEMQQVQLRAQILVYGSLISKLAPEEVHMMSAFGGLDGGRSMWEKAWRAYRERISHQTANVTENETPKQTQTASTQAINKGGLQNRVASAPAGQVSSKITQSSVVNPIIPFSSALWDAHTPYDLSRSSGISSLPHMFSPLHPNQVPLMGNYVGHGATWASEAPFHGPWVASLQTSALDTRAHLSPSPIAESVKMTSLKNSALPVSSSTKNVPSAAAVQGGTSATSVTIGNPPSIELQKMAVAPGQPSVDSKKQPRKRKKSSASTDNVEQITSPSRQEMKSLSVPPAAPNHWAPAVATTRIGLLENGFEKFSTPGSQLSIGHNKTADVDPKRSVLTDDTLGKMEEARLQAQDAAAFASAAVRQSQELWGQLNKQKNSGFSASTEVKLASAAAAIAVAASVAKAAAAAATVASNAALQAKLMAEEASVPSSCGNIIPIDGVSFQNDAKRNGTSISTLKSDAAVQESARRRGEVASAASLEAENLEAIVKAAQLAAEAIEQAGKVIAMGDSIPLRKLIEAGADGFWKISDLASHEAAGSRDRNKEPTTTAAAGPDFPGKHAQEPLQNERARANQYGLNPVTEDNSVVVVQKDVSSLDGIPGSAVIGETSHEKTIKEGSLVEVFKDEDGHKAAWFSADVLSLKDGKAYVSYSELQLSEGSEKLKEWVPLGSEGSNAPRIRIPHPITSTRFEGTRKRRRAVMKDLTFSVGDKVDAWMQESWWEGVITEEGKKNGTAVTVHFPAHGKTSEVKAWQLRPSLVWKDGEWVEWFSTGEKEHFHHEGDTPKQKRKKMGTPGVESKGKDKVVESANPQKLNVLGLTDKEKVFNVGKDKDESKTDKSKTMRAGLRKHDAKVVFGVPKPGKKQKFMEVSKHYVDKKSSKVDEAIDDSSKLANYLKPRVTGTRERRNIPKHESHEKQLAKPKAKVLKSASDHAEKTKDSSETSERSLDKNKSTSHEKDASDIKEGWKPTPDTSEPRRSNRQIQPTSRLLEGLQSSLIGPKAPSHDRGSKGVSKTAATGK